jgi:hypothetical protein
VTSCAATASDPPEVAQPLHFTGATDRAVGKSVHCGVIADKDTVWLKWNDSAVINKKSGLTGKRYAAGGGGIQIRLPHKGWELSKSALIKYLKETHGTIQKLNGVWKQQYQSWQEHQEIDSLPQPATRALHRDYREFSQDFLDRYYRLCAQAVRAVAPQKLYLGSRINHFNNATLVAAAATHCDVVSMNIYQFSVRHLPLPKGFDKPVLIGEYNFGAPGRGIASATSTGCISVEAAANMGRYEQGALTHPSILGAHWFCYYDQPGMGRTDGECGRIGFVDVTDQPYPELVAMSRSIGKNMYRVRLGKNNLQTSKKSESL